MAEMSSQLTIDPSQSRSDDSVIQDNVAGEAIVLPRVSKIYLDEGVVSIEDAAVLLATLQLEIKTLSLRGICDATLGDAAIATAANRLLGREAGGSNGVGSAQLQSLPSLKNSNFVLTDDPCPLTVEDVAAVLAAFQFENKTNPDAIQMANAIDAIVRNSSRQIASSDITVIPPSLVQPSLAVSLVGPVWNLVKLSIPERELAIAGPGEYTLSFSDAGDVSGRINCNSVSGIYRQAGESLSVDLQSSTEIACSPNESLPESFDRDYSEALNRADKFFVREGQLFISLQEDGETLIFEAL